MRPRTDLLLGGLGGGGFSNQIQSLFLSSIRASAFADTRSLVLLIGKNGVSSIQIGADILISSYGKVGR